MADTNNGNRSDTVLTSKKQKNKTKRKPSNQNANDINGKQSNHKSNGFRVKKYNGGVLDKNPSISPKVIARELAYVDALDDSGDDKNDIEINDQKIVIKIANANKVDDRNHDADTSGGHASHETNVLSLDSLLLDSSSSVDDSDSDTPTATPVKTNGYPVSLKNCLKTVVAKQEPIIVAEAAEIVADVTTDVAVEVEVDAPTASSSTAVTPLNPEMLLNVRGLVQQIKFNSRYAVRSAKTPEEAMQKSYKFWSTQPVPKLDEKVDVNEAIELDKCIEEIREQPYTLPDGFEWKTLNLNEPLILKELYTLLNENYVEDDDAMFRFDYQPDFLKWALQPPGWKSDWHVGVRVSKSGRLVGFISAIPGKIRIYKQIQQIVEINFLCVHKKLRSKRVAPVLIREITRRVNRSGIFQAVYTAGVVLPKPIGTCRYWHRSLNPRKLIDVKFSHLTRNMTMQRTIKLYKLPDQPKTPGFRKMVDADVVQAHRLLALYLHKFNITPLFTVDEFRHWILPQNGIIDSFVVENANGEITDFVSYYTLPSTVMHHAVHKSVKAAYAFYNVATTTKWTDLMNDALISAKNLNFDVFNALDLMENKKFLESLKFGIGDGNLQYYLYNWRCPNMQSEDVGLILL